MIMLKKKNYLNPIISFVVRNIIKVLIFKNIFILRLPMSRKCTSSSYKIPKKKIPFHTQGTLLGKSLVLVIL